MSDTSDNFSPSVINIVLKMQKAMNHFFAYRNSKNVESEDVYNHVTEKMCDFDYQPNFDKNLCIR